MLRRAAKVFQKQLYSLLSSKCAIATTLAACFVIIVSLLQFGEVLMEWSIDKYEAQFSIYRDNIGGRSFEKDFTVELPIDVVYTWVNGSDPALIRQLNKLKREIKRREEEVRKRQDEDPTAAQKSNATSSSDTTDTDHIFCPFDHCVAWQALVVSAEGRGNLTLEGLASWSECMAPSATLQQLVSPLSRERVFLVRFSTEADVSLCLEMGLVDEKGASVRSTRGYLTSDDSLVDGILAPNFALAIWNETSLQQPPTLGVLRAALRSALPAKGLLSVAIASAGVGLVEFKSKDYFDQIAKNIYFAVDDGVLLNITLHSAQIVWTPFVHNSPSQNSEESEGDIISANRFEDNEELKYSLRSLEKNAPWIRRIFIVTNGQIPHWLSLDSPRVSLVTHEEIFPDRSHLPTYSSPAIEAHLHRIKGLSKHFIYFNDDVLLGGPVWPEDFYTVRGGQKVYLAWAVPYCMDGCPPNWINDKYCDNACNNSACEWDGEDCKNVTRRTASSHSSYSATPTDVCGTGCLNNWLGDRYCDAACSVPNCGFDAGDCDVGDFYKLYSIQNPQNQTNYTVPLGVTAMFFNLSSIFVNGTSITKATFTSPSGVRTGVVAQKFKVLSFTFLRNTSLSSSLVVLEGKNSTGNNTIKISFTLFVDTATPGKDPVLGNMPALPGVLQSFTEFNDTKSNEFLEHVAMTIQNANRSINYWVTERPRSTYAPTPLTPTEEIPAMINFTLVSEDVLPASAKTRLEDLNREYAEGDWTVKGFSKNRYHILEPYLPLLRQWIEENPVIITSNSTSNAQESKSIGNFSKPDEVKEDNGDSQVVEARVTTDQANTNTEAPTTETAFTTSITPVTTATTTTTPPATTTAEFDAVGATSVDDKSNASSKISDKAEEGEEDRSEPVAGGARRLLSLPQEAPIPVLGPSVEELEVAEDVRKAKEKQLRLKKDITTAIRKWEALYGHWESKSLESHHLPWERGGYFPSQQVDELYREKEEVRTGAATRRLLDTFANSLRHSNLLYNKVYGYVGRKVPAHMPHFIDRDIIAEMQEKFSVEVANTSSHRLRSPYDLQFSFSYFYYVMSEPATLDHSLVFDKYDTDGTGILSARELRTLMTHVDDSPRITSFSIDNFQWLLGNCSLNFTGEIPSVTAEEYEMLYDPSFPLVTKDFMLQCEPLMKKLTKHKSGTKKYKFEELSDGSIAFKMVNENVSLLVDHLDDLRRDPKKFICINDNINHTSDSSHMAKMYIRDYYEAIFPKPSQFELSPLYRNRFLRLEDLKAWQREQQWKERLILAGLISVILLAAVVLLWDQLVSLKRAVFRRLFTTRQRHRHRFS